MVHHFCHYYSRICRQMVTELPGVIGPLVCVFGKFHLTINFNSYVSCDNFKTKTNVNRHLHFSLENVSPLCHVSFQYLMCQLMCGFCLHKSHYMSNSKLCVQLTCIFSCACYCMSNVKNLQFLFLFL